MMSMEEKKLNQLEENRTVIDEVDTELVKLFEQRFAAAKGILEYKKENELPIFDASREEAILKKRSQQLTDTELEPYLRAYFQSLMDISKEYQRHLYASKELNMAMECLKKNEYTCVITNGIQTIASVEKGIRPLLNLCNQTMNIRGYVAADGVVGKAAALLYAHLGIKEVYARILSKRAIEILDRYHIFYVYDELVPVILNQKQDGLCPMEKLTMDVETPSEALEKINDFFKEK